MKRTNSEPLSAILKTFFEDNPQVADRLAENRLISSWEKVLGAPIARYTQDLHIRNRCLYVKLTSSVVKNELMYCRERLVKNLNDVAERDVIDNIIFT